MCTERVPSLSKWYTKGKSTGTGSQRLSLQTNQGTHQARAYPGFRSVKGLGIFLLTPRGDNTGSPLQGYLSAALNLLVPICTPGVEIGTFKSKVSCPRHQHNVLEINPDCLIQSQVYTNQEDLWVEPSFTKLCRVPLTSSITPVTAQLLKGGSCKTDFLCTMNLTSLDQIFLIVIKTIASNTLFS